MKIKRKYWQKVLDGDFPSRLQISLSEPIASDLIAVEIEELAKSMYYDNYKENFLEQHEEYKEFLDQ